VRFNPFGADGELTFLYEVKDWTGKIPSRGVRHRWKLRVALKQGQSELAKAEKDITPDDTPPINVRFEEVNKTKVRDADAILEIDQATSLTLLASGDDPESKIKKVAFLVNGDPDDPKAKWILANRYSDDGKRWIAQKIDFPVGQEMVVVYVKFTNAVDLESKPVKLVIRNGKGPK
jgi:hypothetical protein